jgi:hypothetical protein
MGASRLGRGISSVMWVMASKPIGDKLRALSVAAYFILAGRCDQLDDM